MTLTDYLKTKRLDVDAFALSAEVHRSTIYRALKGEGCSRRTAAKMAYATGGEVTAAEIIAAQIVPEIDDATPPSNDGQAGPIRRAS